MPKSNSKILNWFLGILGTLLATMIIGAIGLLINLDKRTAALVTILELTSSQLKEGIEKSVLQINDNKTKIQGNTDRIQRLEVKDEHTDKYYKRLDELHETVKKIAEKGS